MKVEGGKYTFTKEVLAHAWGVLTDPDIGLREDFKAAVQAANSELTQSRAVVQAAQATVEAMREALERVSTILAGAAGPDENGYWYLTMDGMSVARTALAASGKEEMK